MNQLHRTVPAPNMLCKFLQQSTSRSAYKVNLTSNTSKASSFWARMGRSISTSGARFTGTQAPKEDKEAPFIDYHRSSTRYFNATPQLLQALDEIESIPHRNPQGLMDGVAWKIVRFLRIASDYYFRDNLIYRAMMLETVAAVPGMVAGMIHHLRSLRNVRHDNWIKTLLDEAENERLHLFCWVDIIRPTFLQRMGLVLIQGIFFAGYLATYIFFPKTSHRFVGYLEEEAYKTYTHLLHQIDNGKIIDRPAPKIARDYYGLPENATMRDMTVAIRADEHDHASVNHSMANMIEGVRNRDILYDRVSIDDSCFEDTPGTAHLNVQALSRNRNKKAESL